MSPFVALTSPHPALSLLFWSLDGDALDDVTAKALSRTERERMARFVRGQDGRRFGAGRAGLRLALAGRLDRDPSSLDFDYGPNGRPMLRGVHDLDFNLSHTGGVALLGILDQRALHGRVGVDVESRLDRSGERLSDDRLRDLSRVCFSPHERLVLESAALAHEVFYRTWTRKEAVIKALGDGIAYGLERFDVSGHADARVLRFDDPHEDPAAWSLFDLAATLPGWAGDVAAAVALRTCTHSRGEQHDDSR